MKDVFAKKFLVPGEDSAVGASARSSDQFRSAASEINTVPWAPAPARADRTCAHNVPIEADVGSGGVRITPRLLQRLFENDSLPAGGHEQRIDCLHQQSRAERVTESVAQAHVERRLLAARSAVA